MNMDLKERIFDVWLATAGISAAAACALIRELGSAENAYGLSPRELALRGLLDEKSASSLPKTLDKAYKIIEDCQRLSFDIIPFGSERYPEALAGIKNPPVVLYVWGRLPDVDSLPAYAIVGSRGASAAGLTHTERIAYELAAAGAVVVSGMAKGCDAAAHRGALKAGGLTIAVLGCGPDICYPSENRALYWRIPESGAIVSEYPPKTRPTPYTFPERNRIVSGLSRGVLVAEAAEKSGSLITARLAAEQGRAVYTLPPGQTRASAGNAMLQKSGATVVSTAAEMLSRPQKSPFSPQNQPLFGKKCPDNASKIPENPQKSSPGEAILRALKRGPLTPDELSGALKINVSELSATLTMLEIEGKIHRISGNRFSL